VHTFAALCYQPMSPEGRALQGMMSPRVFPNLRRTHEYRNTPLHKQLSFYFLHSFSFPKKEIIPLETWEHIKLGDLPQHNSLGFFCWGRNLKIHSQNKKGVVSADSYPLDVAIVPDFVSIQKFCLTQILNGTSQHNGTYPPHCTIH